MSKTSVKSKIEILKAWIESINPKSIYERQHR
jgi:hypothetical protein